MLLYQHGIYTMPTKEELMDLTIMSDLQSESEWQGTVTNDNLLMNCLLSKLHWIPGRILFK